MASGEEKRFMKKLRNYKLKSTVANAVFLLLLPIFTLMCTELYSHVPWELSAPVFLLNLVFYWLLFAVFTFLFGSTSRGYAAAPVVPMVFGLINYYVVDFRSSPIVPWDFYSVRTAVSVADNYEIGLSPRVILVLLGFLLIIFLGSRTNLKVKRRNVRVAALMLSVCMLFGYVSVIGTETVVSAAGLSTELFTPDKLYRSNGLAGGFLGILKYLRVEKPNGYSAEKAREIAADFSNEQTGEREVQETVGTSGTVQNNGKPFPNVIVIMNEALSDLRVFGEFETDYEYFPFLNSLEENTVKGTCYVSVKGGNTANTEYEFLTGDSMAFLPAGSVPYQQYVKGEMPTFAGHLKNLGYQTTAIHPYNASGWARDKVYPWFGFDRTIFKNDFENPMKIRNYISDSSAFQKIIELLEEKQTDDPLFVFEVTMQNHGGYGKYEEGFSTVHLTGADGGTAGVRAAEKYLTLMLESDRAFEMLVNYLKKQEEDTIVLMFGDHQPSDYITNVILRLLGIERKGSDEVFFNNYAVPFVIWANFDIGEETVDAVSPNYLSTLLAEKAGIPLSGYQRFLHSLRKELPAITANMIITADGARYRYDEGKLLEADRLNDYNILTYNHLSDTANRIDSFFD